MHPKNKLKMDKDSMRKVKRSFSRSFIGGKDLIQTFYDIFLQSHPSIAQLFEETDFAQQKLLLRQGINCFIMFSEGVYAGGFCLDEITISHNRKHYNIHPNAYIYWKESLLKALEQTDPQFNKELYFLWIEVIDKGIAFISKGY